MTSLILCNTLDRVAGAIDAQPGALRFLPLLESKEGYQIRDYLREQPNSIEMPVADLMRERSASFQRDYVDFMGMVNAENRSLNWWAMPFTNKNPLATSLCRDMAYFLLIAELVRGDELPLLVVTDSPDLVAQCRVLGNQIGTKVVNLVRAPGYWRTFVKLHTPAGILKAGFRTLVLQVVSRRLRQAKNQTRDHVAVVSVTHPRSFLESGGYRDVYFGTLLSEISDNGSNPLLVGLAAEQPRAQVNAFKATNTAFPVVPLESCLTLVNLMRCIFRSLGLYFRPVSLRGPMEIQGVDVSCLVTRAVREARHSGDLFLNLRMFYCALWLAMNVKLSRCVYPFENRSWEKMLILGINQAAPSVKMVGYQHASITMSHTNFMLAPGESEFTPLPDIILTTGDVITRRLESDSNFPNGLVQSACALRQAQVSESHVNRDRSGATKVLVALATKLDEYVKAMTLVEGAFSGIHGFDVRIRPHPEIPLQLALDASPPSDLEFFSESVGTLSEDLEWADVVLYASSTVGLEAIAYGKPVVYLDLGEFLGTDPMFDWDGFKWSAGNRDELINAMQSIANLSSEEFIEARREGYRYVGEYLAPVNADNIRPFWEA